MTLLHLFLSANEMRAAGWEARILSLLLFFSSSNLHTAATATATAAAAAD